MKRAASREHWFFRHMRVVAWLAVYMDLTAIKMGFEVINQTLLYERSFLFLLANQTAFLFNSK